MDLKTKNLIFHFEETRKRAAQSIIDEPEKADNYKIGNTIDSLSEILNQLRIGQLTADDFEESISGLEEK